MSNDVFYLYIALIILSVLYIHLWMSNYKRDIEIEINRKRIEDVLKHSIVTSNATVNLINHTRELEGKIDYLSKTHNP